MKHVCALCGSIEFRTLHEYDVHRASTHGFKEVLKPTKTTGRSPEQIIKDAENSWLKPHLIEGPITVTATDERQHLDACRCHVCFNKQLDKLIASQKQALEKQGGV